MGFARLGSGRAATKQGTGWRLAGASERETPRDLISAIGAVFQEPAFLTYAAEMLEVGAKLPKLTLRDADERAVSLASLHAERPLAAIFLRHFG